MTVQFIEEGIPYVILRDPGLRGIANPFKKSMRAIAAPITALLASNVFPEPKCDVETLTSAEEASLDIDPEVIALAPVMPTQLVAPTLDSTTESVSITTWGLDAVGALDSGFTGADTTVAVLDTGLDIGHEAFLGLNIETRDFTSTRIEDVNGHGTHCAGTILGRDVSTTRIGVARGVPRLLVGKVLREDGSGDSSMVFNGITWALEAGADIVSMSLGFDFPGMVARLVSAGWEVQPATSMALVSYRGTLRVFDALMTLIRARENLSSGALVVAAAGNESRRSSATSYSIACGVPAGAEGVVSVGALARRGSEYDVAPFSNTLPTVCAPGVGILSAQSGGGLKELSGTSMACPHVAGVAALWYEHLKRSGVRVTASNVKARLLASCSTNRIVSSAGVDLRGDGLVSAPA